MKYRFIADHRQRFSVARMCTMLQVARSGFYAWLKRKSSARERANVALVADIRQIHARSRQTYGSRRVHAELRAQGKQVSHKRVARLMQLHGIRARRKQRYKTTTRRRAACDPAPNLVAQDFTAQAANRKWVADITYIDTGEGWLYLAAILDVYSRKIVGWSMHERLHKQLVEDALTMAIGRRDRGEALVHHSDQGSQYTSHTFRALLEKHTIQVSMSGVGNCYDNAMMESFFATLKTECVTERFVTRRQARQTIFEYIEVWYNRCRRHSALGYLSPEQFELLSV
jgi:transposase InsO family protein